MSEKIKKQTKKIEDKIQKNTSNPAYMQLANIIKHKIASGEYLPGTKIPAEVAIGRVYNLSTMTVRQAIGLVVEEGLLKRVQGSGTYVLSPDWEQASFNMSGLLKTLADKKNIAINILKANIIKSDEEVSECLSLPFNSKVIHLDRIISHKGKPFLFNQAFLRFDPASPIVEAELEISSLSGLFRGGGSKFIKKAVLSLEPEIIDEGVLKYLKLKESILAFKISYVFYDYSNCPVGYGVFLTPKKYLKLSTKIGLWD